MKKNLKHVSQQEKTEPEKNLQEYLVGMNPSYSSQ